YPGIGLVAASDPTLDQRAQHDLGGLPALLAPPAADDVDHRVEGVRIAQRGDVAERSQPQLRVLVALHRRDQEATLQLAGAVEVKHRPRPPPAARRHAGTGARGPYPPLAIAQMTHAEPPPLALQRPET